MAEGVAETLAGSAELQAFFIFTFEDRLHCLLKGVGFRGISPKVLRECCQLAPEALECVNVQLRHGLSQDRARHRTRGRVFDPLFVQGFQSPVLGQHLNRLQCKCSIVKGMRQYKIIGLMNHPSASI